jgi:tetratricopeptide (TPR) repeat protein
MRRSATIAIFIILFCSGFIITNRNHNLQSQSTQLVPLTSTPTSIPVPIITPTLPPLTLEEQIATLQKELKEQQSRFLDNQANSAMNYANLIVQWSGFFLTAFTIVLAIASFFGFREYQNIREQYQEVEKIRKQFEEHSQNVEDIEKKIEKQLKELSSKFERESQSFIEASYNFSEGNAAYKKGDNEKAIEYFMRVIETQPLNAHVYCRIGRTYTNLGETQKASESFYKALSIDEKYAEALLGLSTIYRYIDPDKALEYARRATEEDPQNDETFNYLGLLYRDKLRIDDAIIAHEKARRLRENPQTDFFLALLYAHQKDYERAKLMILSANVGLRKEQARGRIRLLWVNLIKWAKLIFEENYDEALDTAKGLLAYVTTPRIAQVTYGSVTFLLTALSKDDLITAYTNLFQPLMDE